MKPAPGTYALTFECCRAMTVEVGRLGSIDLETGYYLYVGSALGPGGVKARVERHWRQVKRRHWHIDYVGEYLTPVEVWYLHGISREEHRWVALFTAEPDVSVVPGFGASDCRCSSHFFHTSNAPDITSFTQRVGKQVQTASPAGTNEEPMA